jgi:hypothetical protein
VHSGLSATCIGQCTSYLCKKKKTTPPNATSATKQQKYSLKTIPSQFLGVSIVGRRQEGNKGSAGTLAIAAGGVVWTCKSYIAYVKDFN